MKVYISSLYLYVYKKNSLNTMSIPNTTDPCCTNYRGDLHESEGVVTAMVGTVMEKSSAPFSLRGDNLKRYFDQR